MSIATRLAKYLERDAQRLRKMPPKRKADLSANAPTSAVPSKPLKQPRPPSPKTKKSEVNPSDFYRIGRPFERYWSHDDTIDPLPPYTEDDGRGPGGRPLRLDQIFKDT